MLGDQSRDFVLLDSLVVLEFAGGLVMERREAISIESQLIAAPDRLIALAAEPVEFLAELRQVLEVCGALPIEFALRGGVPLGQLTFRLVLDRFDLPEGVVALTLQSLDLIVRHPDLVVEPLKVLPELAALLVGLVEGDGVTLVQVAPLGVEAFTIGDGSAFGIVGQLPLPSLPIGLPFPLLGLPTGPSRLELEGQVCVRRLVAGDRVGVPPLALFQVRPEPLDFAPEPLDFALRRLGFLAELSSLLLQVGEAVAVGLSLGAERVTLVAKPVDLRASLVTLRLDLAENLGRSATSRKLGLERVEIVAKVGDRVGVPPLALFHVCTEPLNFALRRLGFLAELSSLLLQVGEAVAVGLSLGAERVTLVAKPVDLRASLVTLRLDLAENLGRSATGLERVEIVAKAVALGKDRFAPGGGVTEVGDFVADRGQLCVEPVALGLSVAVPPVVFGDLRPERFVLGVLIAKFRQGLFQALSQGTEFGRVLRRNHVRLRGRGRRLALGRERDPESDVAMLAGNILPGVFSPDPQRTLTARAGNLDVGRHLGLGSAGIGGRLVRVPGFADDSIMAQRGGGRGRGFRF